MVQPPVQIHLHPLAHRSGLGVLPHGTGWAHQAQAVSRVCSQVLFNRPVESELPGEIGVSDMPTSRSVHNRADTSVPLGLPWSPHRVHACRRQASGDCLSAAFTGTCEQQSLKGGDRQMACRVKFQSLSQSGSQLIPGLAHLMVLDAQSYLSFTTG